MQEIIGKYASGVIRPGKINKVVIISKREHEEYTVFKIKIFSKKKKYFVRIETESFPSGTIEQIREVVKKLLELGFLKEKETVLVIADRSLGKGFEGMFFFFRLDKQFLEHTEMVIERSVKRSIYEAVLDIAREIALEGREGKKVGTIFIIGDSKKVLEKSEQMILNPLEGHPLEKRNVLNPEFKETIKALAVLDGAFIIDEKGYVLAAGRYLLPTSTKNLEVEPGLGTRHRAACAITKETNAVAICLSQEGTIRVYRKGKLVHKESPYVPTNQ